MFDSVGNQMQGVFILEHEMITTKDGRSRFITRIGGLDSPESSATVMAAQGGPRGKTRCSSWPPGYPALPMIARPWAIGPALERQRHGHLFRRPRNAGRSARPERRDPCPSLLGGGEVARYIGRHGTKRVAKAVLIGAVPPLMLKTAANPGGLPIEVFDQIRAAVLADRSQFWKDLTTQFYGYNRPGAKISEGVRESFWLQGMMAGMPASYFCVKAFSETDFTEDLKKFDVPTLILHGDDDQIVPIGASALLSSKLVKGATLKVYKGAPHGLCTTLKDQVNEELLAFFKA